MCGIAGWLSWDQPPETSIVKAMTDALAHRGPDAEGIWVDRNIGLGHRRLSIIDTAPTANQPMMDAEGRCVVVFNGEIYNFQELRAVLEARGGRFRTHSDTEVILESYKQWGIDAIGRLNGMFALALWDVNARRLLLARDRAGEKPLFYAEMSFGLVFASEPRALRRHPAVGRELDLDGFAKYLTNNYVPGDGTLLAGVRKLPPAFLMIAEPGSEIRLRRYWDLAPYYGKKNTYKDEGEAAEALTAELDRATKLRLVSDVPLGAFLSGGVDSGAVVASMSRSSGDVRTFSIGFSDDSYDESGEARATARHLGVSHVEELADLDTASLIKAIVHAADEPLADNSVLPTWLLAQFARRHVTVALSGDGGDELFGGYETYVADRLAFYSPSWATPLWHASSLLAERLLPVSFDKVSWNFKLKQLFAGLQAGWPRAHFMWRTIFDDDSRSRLLSPSVAMRLNQTDPYLDFLAAFNRTEEAEYLDQAMYIDVCTWMVDDVLVKVDRMSMAHGLEVRAPFLDHHVMELAAAIPCEWKVKGVQKKHLLKESQRARLPADVLARPKRGFNAPMAHWLQGDLRDFAGDHLESPKLDTWFVRDEIRKLWDEQLCGRRDNSFKLFGVLCFALWLEIN